MRLLLDEHFSPEIARQLRARGQDVVAAREHPGLHGLPDRELLAFASREGRAIVTENVADFAELHRQWVMGGETHAGIIYTSPHRFPRTKRAIGRMLQALDALMTDEAGARPLADQVRWL